MSFKESFDLNKNFRETDLNHKKIMSGFLFEKYSMGAKMMGHCFQFSFLFLILRGKNVQWRENSQSGGSPLLHLCQKPDALRGNQID